MKFAQSSPLPNCPSGEELAALVSSELEDDLAASIETHVSDCQSCQAALDAIAGGSLSDDEMLAARDHQKAGELQYGLSDPIGSSSAVALDWKSVLAAPVAGSTEGVLGVVGRYQILDHLASGGMGIVFKGYDPETDRTVAVKVLAPFWAGNASSRERFGREARAIASVDHENVLPIYRVEGDCEFPYLVMPFIEGETLAERVKREGSLPLSEIRKIGVQIARGVAAAHAKGIVHRDLKPANILLRATDSRVWVADFGLARAADLPQITMPDSTAGTPQFMAPEQIDGDKVDSLSDLFSLGGLLYFMASGQAPFDGESTSEILSRVTSESPPTIKRAPPPWFRSLLGQLLKKKPEERIATATEVASRLEAGGRTVSPWAMASCLAGVMVLTGLGWAWLDTRDVSDSRPVNAPDPTVESPPINLEGAYVRNVESGRYFANLTEAVHVAESGETLALSGTFRLRKAIVTRPGQNLHLCAIEGASPQIVVDSDWRRCFITNGDVRFSDIHFSRRKLMRQGGRKPSFIWHRGNKLRLERCRIDQAWRTDGSDGHITGCLGISQGSLCVVENCEIYALSAAAFNLDLGEGADESDPIDYTLQVTDSVIVCKQALIRHSQVGRPVSNLVLEMERSAVITLNGFTHVRHEPGGSRPMDPLRLRFADCHVYAEEILMRFPDTSGTLLRERLDWTSSRSHAVYGGAYIELPRRFEPRHEPVILADQGQAKAIGIRFNTEESSFHQEAGTGLYERLLRESDQSLDRNAILQLIEEEF